MSVSKSWTFTKNSFDVNDLSFFSDWADFTYMVFGRETAPTTGTPHLQGYFTLKKAVRPSYLKRILPQGTHFEIARKPELANFRYCTKSRNYTLIDRRHGRDGVPRPVTDLGGSGFLPALKNFDPVSDNFVTRLHPNLHVNLFSK